MRENIFLFTGFLDFIFGELLLSGWVILFSAFSFLNSLYNQDTNSLYQGVQCWRDAGVDFGPF